MLVHCVVACIVLVSESQHYNVEASLLNVRAQPTLEQVLISLQLLAVSLTLAVNALMDSFSCCIMHHLMQGYYMY